MWLKEARLAMSDHAGADQSSLRRRRLPLRLRPTREQAGAPSLEAGGMPAPAPYAPGELAVRQQLTE
eukprot:786923-Pyramimonas_sp.AAC.1